MLTKYELFTESLFHRHKAGPRYTFDDVKNIEFKEEPMNVEDQIKFSIKWYHTSYDGVEARERALSHLFLSVGGGYDWDKDGYKCNEIEPDTDEVQYKYRKEHYDSDYRTKDRKEQIERIKKDIQDYETFIPETEQSIKEYEEKGDKNKVKKLKEFLQYQKDNIEFDKIELERLLKHDTEFDPFYHRNFKHVEKDKLRLIVKIPWGASEKKIDEIPDNVKPDYLNAFHEILSFYAQSRFRKDQHYPTILKMKKKMEKRFGI